MELGIEGNIDLGDILEDVMEYIPPVEEAPSMVGYNVKYTHLLEGSFMDGRPKMDISSLQNSECISILINFKVKNPKTSYGVVDKYTSLFSIGNDDEDFITATPAFINSTSLYPMNVTTGNMLVNGFPENLDGGTEKPTGTRTLVSKDTDYLSSEDKSYVNTQGSYFCSNYTVSDEFSTALFIIKKDSVRVYGNIGSTISKNNGVNVDVDNREDAEYSFAIKLSYDSGATTDNILSTVKYLRFGPAQRGIYIKDFKILNREFTKDEIDTVRKTNINSVSRFDYKERLNNPKKIKPNVVLENPTMANSQWKDSTYSDYGINWTGTFPDYYGTSVSIETFDSKQCLKVDVKNTNSLGEQLPMLNLENYIRDFCNDTLSIAITMAHENPYGDEFMMRNYLGTLMGTFPEEYTEVTSSYKEIKLRPEFYITPLDSDRSVLRKHYICIDKSKFTIFFNIGRSSFSVVSTEYVSTSDYHKIKNFYKDFIEKMSIGSTVSKGFSSQLLSPSTGTMYINRIELYNVCLNKADILDLYNTYGYEVPKESIVPGTKENILYKTVPDLPAFNKEGLVVDLRPESGSITSTSGASGSWSNSISAYPDLKLTWDNQLPSSTISTALNSEGVSRVSIPVSYRYTTYGSDGIVGNLPISNVVSQGLKVNNTETNGDSFNTNLPRMDISTLTSTYDCLSVAVDACINETSNSENVLVFTDENNIVILELFIGYDSSSDGVYFKLGYIYNSMDFVKTIGGAVNNSTGKSKINRCLIEIRENEVKLHYGFNHGSIVSDVSSISYSSVKILSRIKWLNIGKYGKYTSQSSSKFTLGGIKIWNRKLSLDELKSLARQPNMENGEAIEGSKLLDPQYTEEGVLGGFIEGRGISYADGYWVDSEKLRSPLMWTPDFTYTTGQTRDQELNTGTVSVRANKSNKVGLFINTAKLNNYNYDSKPRLNLDRFINNKCLAFYMELETCPETANYANMNYSRQVLRLSDSDSIRQFGFELEYAPGQFPYKNIYPKFSYRGSSGAVSSGSTLPYTSLTNFALPIKSDSKETIKFLLTIKNNTFRATVVYVGSKKYTTFEHVIENSDSNFNILEYIRIMSLEACYIYNNIRIFDKDYRLDLTGYELVQ